MERVIFIIFMITSATANGSVIDLGTLDIEGNVRQPKVQFFKPEKVSNSHLKYVSEKNLNQLEKKILKNLNKTKDKYEK